MKNKIKSYSFWTALAGAVVIFLNALGDCFGFSIDNELVSGLIMSIAGLLVVFGIVTMHENKNEDNNINNQGNSEKIDENVKPKENKDKVEESQESDIEK